MPRVGYDIMFGGQSVSHDARHGGPRLLALRCARGVDLPAGRCVIDVALAAGGQTPALGDPVTVALDGGDGMATVFTGEVAAVTWTALGVRVEAADGMSKLARLDLAVAYEGKTAGQIVGDVLDQAGVTRGTVDDGPTFPSYVLHRGPRALGHLRRLAATCGRLLFTDGDGRACFVAPRAGSADHTFALGDRVLRLCIEAAPPPFDGVVVWGEGTGAGDDKSHWLAADLAGVRGEAAIGSGGDVRAGASGQLPRELADGAVRTGDAAGELAEARSRAAARPAAGFVEVPGAPQVGVGDLLAIDGLQAGAPTQALSVRRIHHRLDTASGFVTRLEV